MTEIFRRRLSMLLALIRKLTIKLGYDLRIFNTELNYCEDNIWTINGTEFRATEKFKLAKESAVVAAGRDYHIDWRTHVFLWCLENCLHLNGDFLEFGTGRGWMMSAGLEYLDWNSREGKTFWTFDRFLPYYVHPIDGQIEIFKGKKSVYAENLESVEEKFKKWKNLEIIKGDLPEILESQKIKSVAFLHIDLNASEPEVDSLKYIWDKIVLNGVILLDDYNALRHEFQKRAIDHLALELNFTVLSLPTGQGLIVKTHM
jgi:hypothetical protein